MLYKYRKTSRELTAYHVCADGRRSVDRSSRCIWNFWIPFIPSNAANPCSGTLDVPVTNCKNLARSAWSKLRSARQNHWIYTRGKDRKTHCNMQLDTRKPITYLNGVSLIFMIFSIGLQILDIYIRQSRYQEFQFLFIEYGNQSFRYNVVESL